MADLLIETDRLAKTYVMGPCAVHALTDVSFAIERGEFVAITGPSGSGKSTLLNLLGCLDQPSAGRYTFDGIDVSRLDDQQLAVVRNRKIGFCFQSFNLLPRASARTNVALPLVYSGIDRATRNARARAALEQVGLGARADHLPTQLSGGQQQRVAIARALINAPPFILADEPTGALDTQSGLEIMNLLARLNRTGLTIVVVTHDPTVVAFTRRVLVLRDGTLIHDRTVTPGMSPTALLERSDLREAM